MVEPYLGDLLEQKYCLVVLNRPPFFCRQIPEMSSVVGRYLWLYLGGCFRGEASRESFGGNNSGHNLSSRNVPWKYQGTD